MPVCKIRKLERNINIHFLWFHSYFRTSSVVSKPQTCREAFARSCWSAWNKRANRYFGYSFPWEKDLSEHGTVWSGWAFPHSNWVCYVCACLHKRSSAATALSLDGWSFSSACSCLMNPALHVLCLHAPMFCALLLSLPTPPHPESQVVSEVGCWQLMNKGSLTSRTSYEAPGSHKQTMTHLNRKYTEGRWGRKKGQKNYFCG